MNAHATISAELGEPNELSTISPWDLDFRQLTKGSGRTKVSVRSGLSITALSIEMQARVHQTGESPHGSVTFGFSNPNTLQTWRGAETPGNALVCFGSGEEFDGISEAGFHAITLSIEAHALERLAQDYGLDEPRDLHAAQVLDLSLVPHLGNLARAKAVRFVSDTPEPETEDDLGLALLLAISGGAVWQRAPSQRLRDRALARALDILTARADDPPTIRELCVLCGTSWPTLRRAFVERFGIGPKTYLTHLRLSRARRDLLASDGAVRVADVANRWGFWHMGEFAAAYRRLFETLPSDDLCTVRVR